MKIKVSDLELVVKKCREKGAIDIHLSEAPEAYEPGYNFEFVDNEGQDCRIKIFPAEASVTPDWVTKKKLYVKDVKEKKE